MAVDQQHVGLLPESIDDCPDCRELPERKIGGNVREVDLEFSFRNAQDLQSVRIEGDRGGEGLVSDVGHIGATERSNLLGLILFSDPIREVLLFRTQFGQERDAVHMVHKKARRNATTRWPTDGAPVRADDLPLEVEIGVFRKPRGHRTRRANVAQGPSHRATRRRFPGRDLSDAGRQGFLESAHHDSPKAQSPQNLSRVLPIGRNAMSLLLKGGLVVTQDPNRRVVREDLFVDGGQIAAIGDTPEDADEVLDCSGSAVLPGLINVHQHVANTLLRGIADDVPLEEMLAKSFALDAKLTRRDVQIGALLGCLEMIRSGTTSFQDLFYWEDEVARAVRESGMRGFLSWVTLDEAYTTQHGNPVKNAEAFVLKHRGDPRIAPSVGVQGIYVASEETLLQAREVAVRLDVRLHAHLSETRKEVYDHLAKTGQRPAEWLDRIGFLDRRLNVAHGVWLTLNEVRILARQGVSVAHCPVSNMKLASGGVAPVPEMMREGVCVGLGTDSALSNNSADLFSEMKTAALLHKSTRWDAREMPAQRVLDMATIEAARALGVADRIGSLEIGKRADIAVVSLQSPHTPPFDPANVISHLVYSSRGGDVRTTIVDGQVLMAGGVVRTVDEDAILERAQETARELLEA